MSKSKIPFETENAERLRKLRQSGRQEDPANVAGYVDEAGQAQGLTGDGVGPYVHAITRASSDGSTGAESVDDGEAQRLLTDEKGRLWVRATGSEVDPSSYSSSALEESHVVKASAGRVIALRMLVTTGIAEDRWLMLIDKASAAATGDTPIWRVLLPNPGSKRAECADDCPRPIPCSNGIVVACSTSEETLTLAGTTGESLFEVLYE